MLIGRVRVFVDNLRWLSTLLINTLLPELFFVDNLRWLSTLLINTLLPEFLQLNAEFNLYSWIVLRLNYPFFSRFRIVTCELVVHEFCR